ncbi:NAD(P)-binding protein [Wallemia mellicola]|nr:NAD(P)-binding protein [Wallemia mellicola]
MSPTILVIGATGNTGRGVIETLPQLLKENNKDHRILALTRSLETPESQAIDKLPTVEVIEKNWTTIDVDWLKFHDIIKIFIAPHIKLQQFTEESQLYLASLEAGVKYIVRVSTFKHFTSPTSPLFYGRQHWAVENLLSQPEFDKLNWTSLQPNIYGSTFLNSTASWIKTYRKTGKTDKLNIILDGDTPAAIISPADVGVVGAHLLSADDYKQHNRARYILAGPEDVTGKDLVKLAEEFTNAKIDNVEYRFTDWIKNLTAIGLPENVIPNVESGISIIWHGQASLSQAGNSKEIQFALPKRTVHDQIKAMIEGATGNTGKGLARTLPELLKNESGNYRVVALTRSLSSPGAKKISQIDGIEVVEKDWTTIDAEWLKENHVEKAYVAAQNMVQQFTEESKLYLAMLEAGVKYLVRVSTFVHFINPASPVYYGRIHWALETMLSQPEFDSLNWTSLQPNYFGGFISVDAINWIKKHRETGDAGVLNVVFDKDAPVAAIDAEEVGIVAAHLLAADDYKKYNKGKYILNGPEDTNGQKLVEAVERLAGTRVKEVQYNYKDFIDRLPAFGIPENILASMFAGIKLMWSGKGSTSESTTSKEIAELYLPKNTIYDNLKNVLAD